MVVVLTAGTRTGWELVGIAEACADARHRVLGAIVTQRTEPADTNPGTSSAPAMAGSA